MYLQKPAIVDDIKYTDLYTYFSPKLDSITYWFNKKNIKLYREKLY